MSKHHCHPRSQLQPNIEPGGAGATDQTRPQLRLHPDQRDPRRGRGRLRGRQYEPLVWSLPEQGSGQCCHHPMGKLKRGGGEQVSTRCCCCDYGDNGLPKLFEMNNLDSRIIALQA